MAPAPPRLRVALVADVFPESAAGSRARLSERLAEAKSRGAQLVVLPELPFDRWIPATRGARDHDAEPVGGPRQRGLAEAATAAGLAVLGGAIVRGTDGRRENHAVVVDAQGIERGRYAKLHLPHEPGFWEADHYQPGAGALPMMALHGVPFGIQICSDLNRPQGAHVLSARGARLLCHPRATDPATFDAWRLVMRATARTAGVWIVSVSRPAPEGDVPLGGPSIVIDPTGAVMVESHEPLTVFDVDPARNDEAVGRYPGTLAVRSDVYATAWSETLPRERSPTTEPTGPVPTGPEP